MTVRSTEAMTGVDMEDISTPLCILYVPPGDKIALILAFLSPVTRDILSS